jgi:hypothetical protein
LTVALPLQPAPSLHATQADVANKIVYLRRNDRFGPMKIKMYLERDHDIEIGLLYGLPHPQEAGHEPVPASQCNKRHNKRCTRYEKQLPGNRVQVDVKFIEPVGVPADTSTMAPVTGKVPKARRRAKYYQFTAIDNCARLRALRIYPRWTRSLPSGSSTTS